MTSDNPIEAKAHADKPGVWCECGKGQRRRAVDIGAPGECALCWRPIPPAVKPHRYHPITEAEERAAWRHAAPARADRDEASTHFDGADPVPCARAVSESEGGESPAAEILQALLDEVFADGPAPAATSRRLVAAARHYRPATAVWWLGTTRSAATRRLEAMGIPPEVAFEVMGAVAQRAGTPLGNRHPSPLGEALPRTADGEVLFDYLWPGGTTPVLTALQRIYAICWQLQRGLLGNMSLTEVGGLFGHGRGAPSALLNRLLTGAAGIYAPGQKGAQHRRRAQRSALGNHNRQLAQVRGVDFDHE